MARAGWLERAGWHGQPGTLPPLKAVGGEQNQRERARVREQVTKKSGVSKERTVRGQQPERGWAVQRQGEVEAMIGGVAPASAHPKVCDARRRGRSVYCE